MKIKVIILALLFLFSGSGIKVEVSTCCDVLSGIALSFKDNGTRISDECCACVKIPNKSSCCHTASFSTVINPILGLNKVVVFNAKKATQEPIFKPVPANYNFALSAYDEVLQSSPLDHRDYSVPILLKKRTLQI